MKRILSLIAFSILFTLTSFAQTRALVTLSHEGQLTFFDNVSAFEDAVNAAVDGDIIYLSEGRFGASTSSFTIKNKKISIIGCGYKSYIIPNITFENSSSGVMNMSAPLFDGVRLEELSFSNSVIGSVMIDQLEIKKCKIDKITLDSRTNNIRLDRCNIGVYTNAYKHNIQLDNCKIRSFNGCLCEFVENCNIYYILNQSPSYASNSIIQNIGKNNGGGVYENCLIGQQSGTSYTEFVNGWVTPTSTSKQVLNNDLECTIEDMSPYVGTDGTVIGVYGGQWFPYSETPSVPTVDSANSSVEYDKETNKLNVTITVAPN
ncbi:MAG: hypothetical protein NC095_02565 [Muribaculum sp.]|nr:hypothetical protein [Muribaculum sp.]